MKWLAWFIAAILSNSVTGAAKFFALLIPAAVLTFLLGTPGYVLGMLACFFVLFTDVQAQSGESFWVEMREYSLWGYLLAGTVIILMANVMTFPLALAIMAASGGLIYGADKLSTWLEHKAASSLTVAEMVTNPNYA